MELRIWDDKYTIRSDQYQYTLFENKRKQANNEEYEVAVGYFTTLQHLFKELAAREQRLSNATSLKEFVKDVNEVYKKLAKLINDVKVMFDSQYKLEELLTYTADKVEEPAPKKRGRKKKSEA